MEVETLATAESCPKSPIPSSHERQRVDPAIPPASAAGPAFLRANSPLAGARSYQPFRKSRAQPQLIRQQLPLGGFPLPAGDVVLLELGQLVGAAGNPEL